jgi:hypothetical protein
MLSVLKGALAREIEDATLGNREDPFANVADRASATRFESVSFPLTATITRSTVRQQTCTNGSGGRITPRSLGWE